MTFYTRQSAYYSNSLRGCNRRTSPAARLAEIKIHKNLSSETEKKDAISETYA
jgi:hypothetical protein